MPEVCLVDAPTPRRYNYTRLPTELLSVAAVLQNNDFDVGVYPGNAKLPQCRALVVWADIVQYSRAITLTRSSNAAIKILCGSYMTAAPAHAMCERLFDYGVVGDPEIPILELLRGVRPRSVPGAVYVDRGVLVLNPKVDLDKLPVPAYNTWKGKWGDEINVCFSREYTLNGHLWEYRGTRGSKGAEDFRQELVYLRSLGAKGIYIEDVDFGRSAVRRAAWSLDRVGPWRCRTTAKTILQARLDQQLRDSKCDSIEIDVYTANKRILGEVGGSLNDVELALELMEEFNVTILVSLGVPGETITSLQETRNWLRKRREGVRVSTFVPLPGMVEYEEHHLFSQYGFEITGIDSDDFWVDDTGPADSIPWQASTIGAREFLKIRNEMVEEFNEEET